MINIKDRLYYAHVLSTDYDIGVFYERRVILPAYNNDAVLRFKQRIFCVVVYLHPTLTIWRYIHSSIYLNFNMENYKFSSHNFVPNIMPLSIVMSEIL